MRMALHTTGQHQKLTTANDILGLPNFAIVRIPEGGDIIKLFSVLLNNGFPEVSFVNEIRENAFLPVLSNPAPLNELHQFPTSTQETVVVPSADNDAESGRNSADHSNHPSPAPSSTVSVQGLNAATAVPSPIPFVARPRGSRTTTVDDPALYAVCQLCHNKIMSSRLSNLTNHVRRHATLKQFQCIYCIYTHNEMAKVRLHMQHNHKDHASQPLDALTPEMQNQWDLLMEKCFPGYAKYSTFKSNLENEQCMGPVQTAELFHACIECGEKVSNKHLVDHLEKSHKSDCIPYGCEECGYQNAEQWKVRLHITLKHSEMAADVCVVVLDAGSNLNMFLHKYFTDLPPDEEESKMLSQFMAPKEERSLTPLSANGGGSCVSDNNDTDGKVRCELCQKEICNYRSLSSLMSHAKRHYHLKQYQCPECSYASSEAAHARTHIALKHSQTGAKPIDNNGEALQNAWIEVMRKCFPGLVAKIDQFRFKHPRSDGSSGSIEDESAPDDDLDTFYQGKRKNSLSIAMPRKMSRLQNCDKEIKTELAIHASCMRDSVS